MHNERSYVKSFSPFEFFAMPTSFSDDLVYNLSHPGNKFAMNSAIPGMTSAWIFDHVDKRLAQVRD